MHSTLYNCQCCQVNDCIDLQPRSPVAQLMVICHGWWPCKCHNVFMPIHLWVAIRNTQKPEMDLSTDIMQRSLSSCLVSVVEVAGIQYRNVSVPCPLSSDDPAPTLPWVAPCKPWPAMGSQPFNSQVHARSLCSLTSYVFISKIHHLQMIPISTFDVYHRYQCHHTNGYFL